MYEIAIYMILAAVLFSYRTVLSGRKNGCFYHKNDNPLPPMLKDEIENIHFLETPAWYAQSAAVFLLTFAIQRVVNDTVSLHTIIHQIGFASLFTLGTVQMPSYYFQVGITAGLKDDDHLDNISKTEIAITIFGKKIQFWRGRLFSNRKRKVAQWLGVIEILAATFFIIFFNAK